MSFAVQQLHSSFELTTSTRCSCKLETILHGDAVCNDEFATKREPAAPLELKPFSVLSFTM
jgi:hypothetical protein